MALPTAEIIGGLIARYRGDAPLQGLLGNPANPPASVFDAGSVPINQPFPYIVVGTIVEQLGTAFVAGRDGVDSYVQVSVFTQGGGFKQVRDIATRLYAITHMLPLDLSANSFTQFLILFENKQEITDGISNHIPMRFKMMTQDRS